MRARLRNRSFRWPLERVAALTAVALVVLTASAILLPAWLFGERETAAVATDANAAVADDARREIDGLFNRIEALQETARAILASGAVDIHDRTGRDSLFMGLLRADPTISWVSFGFADGDFYGANRREMDRYRLVESRWEPGTGEATRRIRYLAGYEGAVYPTHEKTIVNDYNAAARSWYKKAIGAEGAVWTDVYRFASTGQPGLNAAVRVEADGEPLGVVSIAIELGRLDAWLADYMRGRSGVAFILDPEGRLVAASEPASFSQARGDEDAPADRLLPTPATSERPRLAAAAEAIESLRATGGGALAFKHPSFAGQAYLNLGNLGSAGWSVGTVLPEHDLTSGASVERQRMLLAAAMALAIVAFVAIRLTRALFVRPLKAASGELSRFRRFELSGRRPLRSNIKEVAEIGEGLEGARRSLAAFARYAPAELARKLLEDADHGGAAVERRTITILFLDLEGFTSATERLGHRLAPQLDVFLTAMTEAVRENGGVVDKFIGDAVMALFGAPDEDDDHALNACRAALACVAALDRLNRKWAEADLPTFRMRVGVNTGRVLVGSIGAPDRLNYTAIGDPVNLAARLESLNRDYGTAIMIGQQTYDLVKYDVMARRLDSVRVKGKTERAPVFELISLTARSGGDRADWILLYERGLDAMTDGDHEAARRAFETARDRRGADTASTSMLARLPSPQRDPAFDKLEEAAEALIPTALRNDLFHRP